MAVQVETLAVGPLEVNCYLAWDTVTQRGVVLDPGDDGDEIAAAVRDAGFTAEAVLLTHAHVDHIGAVGTVCRRLGLPVYLHPADVGLYRSRENAVLPWLPPARDLPQPAPAWQDWAGLGLAVLATPGHTPGCVCYHLSAAGLLFSGDTLFCAGVGRTDLPGGNAAALQQSICSVLYALPGETRVFPGHGGPTTIAAEKRGNPYVRA